MAFDTERLAPLGPRGARLAYELDAARLEGRSAELARLLMDAGDALAAAGVPRAAVGAYEAAFAEAEAHPDARRVAGDAAWRAGQLAEATRRLVTAYGWYDRAAARFRADGAVADEVTALQASARCRIAVEGPVEALRLLTEAVALAREAADPSLFVSAMEQLAEVSSVLAHHDDAAARFREAARLYAELGDDAGRVRATIGLAESELDLGDHVKAVHTLSEVEPEIELGLDDETTGRGLALIARFYLESGERTLAGERFVEAIDHLSRAGATTRRAELMMAFGRKLRDIGDDIDVVPLFQTALTLFEETGDKHRMGPASYQLASAYYDAGILVRADQAIDRALALCQELGDIEGLDVCTRLGVKVAVRMGQGRLALERLKLAARVRGELGDHVGEVRYLFRSLEATMAVPDMDANAMADELMEALRRTGTRDLAPGELEEIAERLAGAECFHYAVEVMTVQATTDLEAGRREDAARAFGRAADLAVRADAREEASLLYDQAISLGAPLGLAEVREWRIHRDIFGASA